MPCTATSIWMDHWQREISFAGRGWWETPASSGQRIGAWGEQYWEDGRDKVRITSTPRIYRSLRRKKSLQLKTFACCLPQSGFCWQKENLLCFGSHCHGMTASSNSHILFWQERVIRGRQQSLCLLSVEGSGSDQYSCSKMRWLIRTVAKCVVAVVEKDVVTWLYTLEFPKWYPQAEQGQVGRKEPETVRWQLPLCAGVLSKLLFCFFI